MRFLVVEDDPLAQANLNYFLRPLGEVHAFDSVAKAKAALGQSHYDLCFVDLDLESALKGLELLPLLSDRAIYSVVLSGREEEMVIEKAYSAGAKDYLVKPFTREAFELIVKKYELVLQSKNFKEFFEQDFVTSDPDLLKQLEVLPEVLVSHRPIYLRGGTGTGKSYIAKLIHKLLGGDQQKLVHLNCAEIPENLLESELFGHEAGAFTGAVKKKLGKLALADGGTLFLDEIGTMPISIQKKMLRVLEEKKFTPLGSTTEQKSNFRLISATCDDLEKMVEEGSFRQDLYFRLEGHNLMLRDLAERKGDIPRLIRHFVGKSSRRVVFSTEAMRLLIQYSWPGNVRELQKLVEMMCAKSVGIMAPEQLPAKYHRPSVSRKNWLEMKDLEQIEEHGLKAIMEQIEVEAVRLMLQKKEGRIRDAFNALQISSSSFYRIKERLDGVKTEE